MRNFLVNFIYTSASHSYNADFVLFAQETFPTSHEIYKHIKATAVAKVFKSRDLYCGQGSQN